MKTPRLSAAACAAILEERPSVPRPARAACPWSEWTRPGVVHLAESGVDYHCSARQFGAVLSTYAGRHDLSVSVSTFRYERQDGGPTRAVVLFRFTDRKGV